MPVYLSPFLTIQNSSFAFQVGTSVLRSDGSGSMPRTTSMDGPAGEPWHGAQPCW
jgi:hypothetical protein